MTIMEEPVREELRETQYPKLRVLTGGKGPPEPPPVNNWLAELAVGTTFVARERTMKQQLDYNLYHVLFKDLPKVMLLTWKLPDGKLLDCYVDPQRFSNRMELGVVLGIETEAEQPPKEVSYDPDGDRSD